MTQRSKELLQKVYGVPKEKIAVIPHGFLFLSARTGRP